MRKEKMESNMEFGAEVQKNCREIIKELREKRKGKWVESWKEIIKELRKKDIK